MAKSTTFEKRLASLEKTITDFFTGGSAKKKTAKKAKRKSVKAKKKTAKRKRA